MDFRNGNNRIEFDPIFTIGIIGRCIECTKSYGNNRRIYSVVFYNNKITEQRKCSRAKRLLEKNKLALNSFSFISTIQALSAHRYQLLSIPNQ